jgi:hypothetical protein
MNNAGINSSLAMLYVAFLVSVVAGVFYFRKAQFRYAKLFFWLCLAILALHVIAYGAMALVVFFTYSV